MHFITNSESSSEEGGISDKLVLGVTFFLLIVFFTFPIWEAIAETAQEGGGTPIVINTADRDYSMLLSSLFGRVERSVPQSAHTYVQDVDEYRSRVAKNIKENNRLISTLYVRVDNFPKNLADGYRAELDEIKNKVAEHKVAILPYIESDAFLSRAVIERYELYTSFVERIVESMNTRTSFGNLNKIRTSSYDLRKDIALLYQKIHKVTRD